MILRSGSWPLQRASTVIIQKSLREGFGLTVTEACGRKSRWWLPRVGGIPTQIVHKHAGLLVHSVEGRRLSDLISALQSFIGATTG
jgi:trehalose synthase